jgi:CheY-like chemotaxis protein
MRILIVHPDRQMCGLIEESIKEKREQLLISSANDQLSAVQWLQSGQFQLVISDLNLPPDRHSLCDENHKLGQELLLKLPKLGQDDCSSILMVPGYDPRLTHDLKQSTQIVIGSDFQEQVTEEAIRALSGAPLRSVKIIFTLDLDKKTWLYSIEGGGNEVAGSLSIDPERLRDIIERSQRLGTWSETQPWADELRSIGRELERNIFLVGQPNIEFYGKMHFELGRAGRPVRKSICFTVERSVHPAVLEALTLGSDLFEELLESNGEHRKVAPRDQDFLMLKVPIYRTLLVDSRKGRSEASQLVDGSKKLSALVIESPAEGIVKDIVDRDGRPLKLDPLNCVGKEGDWVAENLKAWGVDVVRVRPEDTPPGKTVLSFLLEKLSEKVWDIVHYAGHTHYVEGEANGGPGGYLFFPNRPIDKMEVGVFGAKLRRTPLLFLSSCQGAEVGFVFELAKYEIPTILGFRWKTEDAAAFEFTRSFYYNLFEDSHHWLETAFMKARKAAYHWNPRNKIWASPILVMQGER